MVDYFDGCALILPLDNLASSTTAFAPSKIKKKNRLNVEESKFLVYYVYQLVITFSQRSLLQGLSCPRKKVNS